MILNNSIEILFNKITNANVHVLNGRENVHVPNGRENAHVHFHAEPPPGSAAAAD